MQLDNKDEFADVAESFNRMAGQFAEVVRELERSIEQLASGAEELSVTSIQTNQGVQRQQEEVEQVAMAIAEMAGTVQVQYRKWQKAHPLRQWQLKMPMNKQVKGV